MAKKKADMSVFDRMISGNESEPEQPEEKTEQLPGQMEISDFTGASEEMTAAPEEQQTEKKQDKPKKKSFCFRADPDQIRRWKIFAASSGITVEQLCVTAIEEYINKTVSK